MWKANENSYTLHGNNYVILIEFSILKKGDRKVNDNMVITTTEAKIKGRNEEWNKQKNIYDDRKTATMNRRKSYTEVPYFLV